MTNFAAKNLTLGQTEKSVKACEDIKSVKAPLQETATSSIEQVDPTGFTVLCTITIGRNTKESIRDKLKDDDSYVSDMALGLLNKPECTISDSETTLELVGVSVADLGYKNGAGTEEVHNRGVSLGLELCPAEVGPELQLQYIHQPKGEWLRMAMKPIIGSYDSLLVFRVGRGDDGVRCLYVSSGKPDEEWCPESRFIFVRPKVSGPKDS